MKLKLHNLIKKEFHILITKKQKQKKKTQIHKVLQISSMSFHILKSLNNNLINNTTSYVSFNVHNQTISSIEILFLNTIKIIIIIASIV